MNLAKKGTVLLAAVSVFALASCNNNGSKEMTYSEALAWVEEHYTKEKSRASVKKVHTTWDYSKNVGKEKVEGVTGAYAEAFNGQTLDTFTHTAVEGRFHVDSEENKGEKDIDGSHGLWGENSPFNSDHFIHEYDHDPATYSTKFVVENDALTVTVSYELNYPVVPEIVNLVFQETEIRYLDKDGYTSAIEYKMEKKDVELDLTKLPGVGEKKKFNLGDFNCTAKVTATEFDVEPVNP